MIRNNVEEVETAEMGDKGSKTELEDITTMGTSAIIEQIHKIPIQDCETEPSTSGMVMLDAATETEIEIQKVPSSTPPPTSNRVPPTYSAVMRMGPSIKGPKKSLDMDPSKIFARIPPPSYAQVEGIWSDLPGLNSAEEVVLFGPDPVYMACPHCTAIVMTGTHTRRSSATHITACVLCLFGCWPCCLLPYFMNSFKNTYHYCPVCNYLLGSYHPI